ncbi:MAG: hypothetical protein ACFE9S_12070 [Candidatus Hermodarchaeota archaeon]
MVQAEGEIHGSYFKQVMSAMMTAEYTLPELSKEVSELDERTWYPLQIFSDMLYKVAEKMPPIVMCKIGRNIFLAAQDTLLKFGFDTFDKLGRDVSITLTGIVRKVDPKKIQKTNYWSSNKAIIAYSKITPAAYSEGIIRGALQMYKKILLNFEITENGDFNIFTLEFN